MRPRRVKLNEQDWFTENRKQLMQEYIRTPTPLFWEKWLKERYEVYRG